MEATSLSDSKKRDQIYDFSSSVHYMPTAVFGGNAELRKLISNVDKTLVLSVFFKSLDVNEFKGV
jgi:hypothetical protein